jgi:hypothetical protein
VRKPSEIAYEVETNFQYLWKSIFFMAVFQNIVSPISQKKNIDELISFKVSGRTGIIQRLEKREGGGGGGVD